MFVDPKNDDWQDYTGATCVTPNFFEFQSAVRNSGIEHDSDESAGRKLRERFFLDYLMVTKGAEGMILYSSKKKPFKMPTLAREVYDVSGAGDTVIGALAASHSLGIPFEKSMELANVAAGAVVGRLGTYAITRADMEQALLARCGLKQKFSTSIFHAKKVFDDWRLKGFSIVFTNGCFDLLHSGHIKLLQEAKECGDKLVVGLNDDESVKRLKGSPRPILKQRDRIAVISALESVDLVLIFSEDTPVNLIRSLRPDVLVKGKDYSREEVIGHEMLGEWSGRVKLVDLYNDKNTVTMLDRIKAYGNTR